MKPITGGDQLYIALVGGCPSLDVSPAVSQGDGDLLVVWFPRSLEHDDNVYDDAVAALGSGGCGEKKQIRDRQGGQHRHVPRRKKDAPPFEPGVHNDTHQSSIVPAKGRTYNEKIIGPRETRP